MLLQVFSVNSVGAGVLGGATGDFSVNPLWVQGHLVVLLQVISVNPLWVQKHLVMLLQVCFLG